MRATCPPPPNNIHIDLILNPDLISPAPFYIHSRITIQKQQMSVQELWLWLCNIPSFGQPVGFLPCLPRWGTTNLYSGAHRKEAREGSKYPKLAKEYTTFTPDMDFEQACSAAFARNAHFCLAFLGFAV